MQRKKREGEKERERERERERESEREKGIELEGNTARGIEKAWKRYSLYKPRNERNKNPKHRYRQRIIKKKKTRRNSEKEEVKE